MEGNGWVEWSRHVLKELDRFEKQHEIMNNQLSQIHLEIALLRVKSGIWGAIAGVIPAAIVAIYFFISKKY